MNTTNDELARKRAIAFERIIALVNGPSGNGLAEAWQENSVDWNAFISHAYYHGVGTVVFERLFDYGVELPVRMQETGHELLQKTSAFNTFRAKETDRLLHYFQVNGLPALAFKGPFLASQVYGSLSRRACQDVDLLIPPDQFDAVRGLLQSDGYRLVGQPHRSNFLRANVHMAFNRQASFIKGAGVYQLDVHTALMPPLFHYPISFDQFWERSVNITVGSYRIRTFSPEDNVQLLCFHGVKNRWSRLKHVLDIDRVIRYTDVDWDLTMSTAQRIRARRILFMGLWISMELFGTQLPDDVRAEVQRDRTVAATGRKVIRRLASREETTYLERVRFNMNVQDDTFTRIRYAGLSLLRRLAGITEH